jgi:PAS domain S-box-containing protein
MRGAKNPARTITDLLFDEVGAGLCLVAPDGAVLRANAEWLRSTGFTEEQVVGENIIDLFPETRDTAVAMHARARAGHRVDVPRHAEVVNGRETWWEGSIEPVPMEGGTGLLVALRAVHGPAAVPDGTTASDRVGIDITERKRAEETPRDDEERVRLKVESIRSPSRDIENLQLADILDAAEVQAMMDEFHKLARIPMAVIDVRGKVLVGVGWQEICTKFHRVHPETCSHCIESDTQLSASVPPGEIRRYRCKNNMWDVATPILVGGHHLGSVFTGQFFFDDEAIDYELFRAQAARYGFDERAYMAALDAVPRLSREAVAAGMAFLLKFAGMLSRVSFSNIKLARSLAERESLTRSLEESKARLEEGDRRKDEFLAMLSHELRNPLAPIRNSTYILQHASPGSDQARRAQDVIQRQTEHITRLVDDLLDITRIARGKIELRRAEVDLRDVVLRAADDFRVLMEERGVAFHVKVPATRLLADADATRLTQVVGNLLHNAAKFTPCRGKVTLTLAALEHAAEIRVRDTGAGIEPALLPNIFDAFVQGSRTLARTEGGLGLGLAMVKGIAELHGGSVRTESAGVAQGAEFIVRLPLLSGSVAHATVSPSAGPTKRRRFLVVDDNRDAAESLAEILRLLGHSVDVAYDGPSALEAVRASPPDVVLCDIGLPGMSGYEVAKALREAGTAAQLFAVSGYAQPEDVKRAVEAGFDGHVAKPCEPEQIERLLS